MTSEDVKKDLLELKDLSKTKNLQRFFKTGKGEYGEGDIFLGINVPKQREISKKYTNLELSEIQKLLSSKIHEERLTSLLILINKYKKTDKKNKKKSLNFI